VRRAELSSCGDEFLGEVKRELFLVAGAWGPVPECSIWAPMLDDLTGDAALRRDGRELLGGGLLGAAGLCPRWRSSAGRDDREPAVGIS
jgi:hypothetical protein